MSVRITNYYHDWLALHFSEQLKEMRNPPPLKPDGEDGEWHIHHIEKPYFNRIAPDKNGKEGGVWMAHVYWVYDGSFTPRVIVASCPSLPGISGTTCRTSTSHA
jgi:hypothetical protein